MRNTKLWKKTTAILMCAAMLTGLCACSKGAETGSSETVADSNGAKTEQAAESEDEVITLTVMGEVGNDCISTDDAIGRKIKEELGIVLECTMVTNDKLKVMAAGGDLPDIIQLHEAPTMAKSLIDAGALYPMDEWLENNGENIKTKIPDGLKWSKDVLGGGQTYVLPVAIEVTDKENPKKNGFVGFFTRWDCYKELGCPEITSEDEYLDVLKQMVDAHPETEDGKKVYALSGWTDWGLWPYKISYPFSFGYENLDNNQLFSHVTGELEDMFIKEDGIFWKSLSFFNKAYRMGIMDPEAFTMKNAQYHSKVSNGEILVAADNWDTPDVAICGENAGMYVLPGAFPYIAGIYPLESRLGYTTTNAICISANCKYPEKAMELLEYLNSDEGSRLVRTGIQGEDWDIVDGKPELIGKRLDNFVSNNTQEKDYADKASPQGIGKYSWMCSIQAINPTADGYPNDLTNSKEYTMLSVSAADKDFSDYYGAGKAQYPGEAYVQLVEEGKMKSLDANLITGKLMEPVSDDAVKIFSKADEYFQANIAKIITCEDEAAFEAQKQKMISDVLAMGYEKALAEVQEQFEKAKEMEKQFQ
ncbi:extracellular solute-binding protein [Eisenbergiella tayi]|uniref:extracellular solute-binding protein n=1 Tax=Eisenbergiella tayi TaxID=1432052 RepID=UPI00242C5B08|nr:extracellular solute-binding protein [Eisenbergiella tayi]